MIIGIGTDLVEIGRIRRLLEEPGGRRFIERVLTPEERRLSAERQGRLTEFVAGRFAAKEAVVKALGTGISAATGFQDVEVLPSAGGQPVVRLSEAALAKLGRSGLKVHLSITHTAEYASAYAVAEEARG
ncbi:holo-ACP synthase [Gorillibacterium sp. sgz5001074]|uniref:holo-ACP synthase n=1 Tax=Gorillibacterium sp. sgz5001074 TaxID=3446695 RepID=UPI003F67398D